MKPHTAVLQAEVLAAFEGVQLRTFFDGTVGAGGHAAAILEAHPEIERYLACDRDPSAHQIAGESLKPWGKKVEFIRGSYSNIGHFLTERKLPSIDGFLIDIGVSSMQLNEASRGFSFRFEGPLDMRMDPEATLTAAEIVNRSSERDLEKIFREFGEESRARQAAKAIVEARRKRKILTTEDLIYVVEPVLRKRGRIHAATLIFQALRIAVNDELGELERGLAAATRFLAPEGRLAVISFHSLEDRIAKNFLRDRAKEGTLKLLTKKPIVPSLKESRGNPRSRSAKLRVAEKQG
jgi:16S rRNA (cytosine1402-N4)-methyltransferase